jgi:hypothetical protein
MLKMPVLGGRAIKNLLVCGDHLVATLSEQLQTLLPKSLLNPAVHKNLFDPQQKLLLVLIIFAASHFRKHWTKGLLQR